MASWRIRFVLSDEFKALTHQPEKTYILAHWHGDELALLPTIKKYPLCTMTSTSKDGALMNYVLNRLGMLTSRGSSTRGAVSALKGLIRLIKSQKRNPSMAVDGPKGPIYRPKPGVFELARLTKGQITPVAAAASHAKIFEKAWNKTFLPLPFSKVIILIGAPWPILDRTVDPKSTELAEKLRLDINAAKQQAVELITAI
ncbi:MAG: DUF374 domain-containing protein [Bdellovibrionales bacterium]|nr:DUF374 domain-containing protein [Bdellovibrionales bacterium]